MTSTSELLALVNEEADNLRLAKEAFNATCADTELHYCDTRVDADCRAFALKCLMTYKRMRDQESKQ
jgi:hypothetical protein